MHRRPTPSLLPRLRTRHTPTHFLQIRLPNLPQRPSRLLILHPCIRTTLQLLKRRRLLDSPHLPVLVLLVLQLHPDLIGSGPEEGAGGERFFARDAGLGFLGVPEAVEFFACGVVGGGWGEAEGLKVVLALDDAVVSLV